MVQLPKLFNQLDVYVIMLLEVLKLISAALFRLNERTKHPDSNQNHSTAAATITAVAVKVSYFVIRVSTKQDKVFSVVNTATHLLNHNILHNLFPARAQKKKNPSNLFL